MIQYVNKQYNKNFKNQSSISNRLHIIEGDVIKTLDSFLQQNSGARFSLVYFDLDLYEPTKISLEKLWEEKSDRYKKL